MREAKMARIARSSGVSTKPVEIKRGNMRRRVDMPKVEHTDTVTLDIEKWPVGGTVTGRISSQSPQMGNIPRLDISGFESAMRSLGTTASAVGLSDAWTSLIHDSTRDAAQRVHNGLADTNRPRTQPTLEEQVANGVAMVRTLSFEIVNEMRRMAGLRPGANVFEFLEEFIGPVRPGYVREVEQDVMRRGFTVIDSVDIRNPPPGFVYRGQRYNVEVGMSMLDSMEARHIQTRDWNQRLGLPPALRLVGSEQDPRTLTIRLVFEATQDAVIAR